MKFPREFYINKDYKKLTQYPAIGEPQAIVYGNIETLCAQGFVGKRAKPDWHYIFRNHESMMKHINDYLMATHLNEQYKNERKEKRKSHQRGLNVGDILYSSWGYDQTNIDYYQVTRLVGKASVEIREIGAVHVEDCGWMQGKSRPDKDNFIGEPMIKRVGEGDSVKVRNWGVWAYKTNLETLHHWTAYA